MHATPFSGTLFWLLTFIFIATQAIIQKVNVSAQWRNWLMITFSLLIISLSMNHAIFLVPFLIFLIALVYYLGNYYVNNNTTNLKSIYIASILLIVIILCYFKYQSIQSIINNAATLIIKGDKLPNVHIVFIGISYFSFKFIHFITDCKNKKITNIDFPTFINFILFFPSFFSGPINRYTKFADSINKQGRVASNLMYGMRRLINGLFKKIVLGDFFYLYSITSLDINVADTSSIIFGMYAYMFYIYFNFSGYTDMAIGCGKMVGITLPENFNYPFLRRNIQEFWANWHISLTTWLTDYIYWPLAKKIRKIPSLRNKAITISNISIFITFVICGIWHGDGVNYLIWGAYNGAGLAILNIYSYSIKKFAARETKKFIHNSPVVRTMSTVITFHFVGIGFLIFSCNFEKLSTIMSIIL